MTNRICFPTLVLLVALILNTSLASGQDQAGAILGKALEAHGKAAIDSVNTIIVRGQLTTPTQTRPQPFTLTASLDGYVRVDLGPRRTIITTPYRRFEILDGKISNRPSHVGVFSQFDILGPVGIGQFSAPLAKRTLQETSNVQGRPAYRIHVDSGARRKADRIVLEDAADLYIDQGTNLIVGMTRLSRADRIDIQFLDAFVFADYKAAGGVLFPHRIERYLDGVLQQVIAVRAVELNPPVNLRMFEE